MNKFRYTIALGLSTVLALGTYSCKNGDTDFPDHEDGVSAYFSHQYPVKTITLGDDPEQDNTLDNQHKCRIYATQGGAYDSRNLQIDVVVDESLTANLTFPDGRPVKAMPSSYYSLSSTTLTKMKDYLFGTEVTLSDAFFADPAAVDNTYVIPLRMIEARGADYILSGTAIDPESQPARTDAAAWSVKPQDYILYCVTYINPYDAYYLRRGVDQVTDAAGNKSTNKRHAAYVEKDEVVKVSTKSTSGAVFPVSTVVTQGDDVKTYTCDLALNVSDNGDVTISSLTDGMTASGSGKFVKLGEKKAFDNRDCDALYLNYTIDFGPVKHETTDTLVMRNRGVAPVFDFQPVYTK